MTTETYATGEELDYFIGMLFKEALEILDDLGVEHAIEGPGISYNNVVYSPNRVRLYVNSNDIVVGASYG